MKKWLKNTLAATLSGAISLALLVGCGGPASSKPAPTGENGGGDAQKPVHLNFGTWSKTQEASMNALIDAYTAENSHVTIELQITPTAGREYWTKLQASATGGTAPDIFWMNVLNVQNYVDGGILEPLDDAISQYGLDLTQFPESLLSAYNFDGKQYCLSKDFDTNAIWYNKEIFDAAGIAYPTDNWTWEEMVETARKLNAPDKGIYGLAAPLSNQACYYNTVFAAGGYILSEDGKSSGYADPKTMAGLQCWIDLIDEGISPSLQNLTDTSADAMFQSGILAMICQGSYYVPDYMENENISSIVDVAKMPTFQGGEGNVINGLGYAVYSKSPNIEEAKKFVVWLASEDAMRIQGQSKTVISSRKDAQQYFISNYPDVNMQAYLDVVDVAKLLPISKYSPQLFDLENKWLKLAYAGEISLQEACTSLQEEADAVLAKG